jgi:hypothetical protein
MIRSIPKKGQQFKIVQLQAYGRSTAILEVCPGKTSTTLKITDSNGSAKIRISFQQQARLSRKMWE